MQQRDLDHWRQVFASREACVTPVASLDEVQQDAAFAQRGSLADDSAGGRTQAAGRSHRSSWRQCEEAGQTGRSASPHSGDHTPSPMTFP